MTESPTTRRTRWGTAAGILGAATAFVAIAGAGPAPSLLQLAASREDVSGNCDEAEHANDPACGGTSTGGNTSTTVDDSTSTTLDDGTSTTLAGSGSTTPVDELRTIDANGAGMVIVAVEAGSLRLVAATPSTGWQVEVEQSAGREVEVDFRSGSKRVQVNVELEDGQVRERVRARDDASSDDSPTVVDDNSGHGSSDDDSSDDSSGHDDSSDDSSSDDDSSDDRSGSGHGSDDSSDDDSSSGSGRDHAEDS